MKQMSTTEIKNIIYAEKQIAEDINFFIKSVEEISPFPYMRVDSQSVQNLVNELKKKGERNGKALYLDFMELAAAFNVGHIYTFPPEMMLDEAVQNADRFFPLFVNKKQGKWEIIGSMDSSISEKIIGTELKTINGIETEQIIDKFLHLIADPATKEQSLGASLPFLLWAANFKTPFTIELKNKENGSTETIVLQGTNDLAKFRAGKPKDKLEKLDDFISFDFVEQNVGYINAKSFYFAHSNSLLKEFSKMLNSYFNALQKKNVSNLIIDLRENSGGSGFPAEAILQKIAGKAYRQTGGSTMRVSAQFKEFLDGLPWALKLFVKKGMMKDYHKYPVGTNIKEETKPTMPKKVKNRFEGQVYVLIGPGTHSAAMMMANAIEDYELGILVGQPTVSIPRELSNALPLKTPNAKVTFVVPATLFTRANGDPNNFKPVTPDLITEPGIEKVDNKKDSDLQYIINKIKGGQ
jgi:hypothetical protein